MVIRKLIVIIVAGAILAGCATNASTKESNKHQIQAIKQVQIIYPKKDRFYTSYVGGTTNVAQVSGIFGVLGTLIGTAVDLATVAGTGQQIKNRSEAFTEKAISVNQSPSYMNELVVNKLKAEFEKNGYKVVTKQVELSTDKELPSLIKSGEKIEGYSNLIVNVTSGYYANGLSKPYYPVNVVKYVLLNDNQQLFDGTTGTPNLKKSYNSYDEIMNDFDNALNTLKTDLEPAGSEVYKRIFVFPTSLK